MNFLFRALSFVPRSIQLPVPSFPIHYWWLRVVRTLYARTCAIFREEHAECTGENCTFRLSIMHYDLILTNTRFFLKFVRLNRNFLSQTIFVQCWYCCHFLNIEPLISFSISILFLRDIAITLLGIVLFSFLSFLRPSRLAESFQHVAFRYCYYHVSRIFMFTKDRQPVRFEREHVCRDLMYVSRVSRDNLEYLR